jgi:hypothetical protein
VECSLLAGQDDRTLTEAESLAAASGPSGDPVFRAALQRLQGVALARRGDRSAARAYLDGSVDLGEKAGAPFELAQSLTARASAGGLSDEEKLADEQRAGELFARLGVIRTWEPVVP